MKRKKNNDKWTKCKMIKISSIKRKKYIKKILFSNKKIDCHRYSKIK